MSLTCR